MLKAILMLGLIADALIAKRDVQTIFNFRKAESERIFGGS